MMEQLLQQVEKDINKHGNVKQNEVLEGKRIISNV
jgi:hypothetical protein